MLETDFKRLVMISKFGKHSQTKTTELSKFLKSKSLRETFLKNLLLPHFRLHACCYIWVVIKDGRHNMKQTLQVDGWSKLVLICDLP